MADKTRQNVETKFSLINGKQYEAAVGHIGQVSGRVGSIVGRFTGMFSPLKLAIAGAVGGFTLARVAELGSAFEDTRRAMAGMFQTFGMAGDFNQGMKVAEQTMSRINAAAARLPGEAEEYMQVFQANLPQLQNLLGNNIDQMTEFSNKFTALSSTMGTQGPEAAFLLARALSVGRGTIDAESAAFRTKWLPFIQRATAGTRQHVSTVAQFNKLTQQQRFEVLKVTMAQEGLQKMLEDAEGSWTAQAGTTTSIVKKLFRLSTTPLFEGMKASLKRVNTLLMDEEGNLTKIGRSIVDIGKTISNVMVEGMERFVSLLDQARGMTGSLLRSIMSSPIFRTIAGVADKVVSAAKRSGAGGVGMAGGAALGGYAAGPMGAAVGAALGTLAGHTGALNKMFNSFLGILQNVMSVLEPLVQLVMVVGKTIGESLATVLPVLFEGMKRLSGPIYEFLGGVMKIARFFIGVLGPMYTKIHGAVAKLWEGLTRFLAPGMRVVGVLVQGLVFVIGGVVTALTALTGAIWPLIENLGALLGWIGNLTGKAVDAVLGPAATGATAPGMEPSWMTGFRDFIDGLGRATATQEEAAETAADATRPTVPGERGGGKTVQDFRYSRFDITQKYAEGFDPDRIAVAFAQDLGRIGEQRLQSGLEPAFTVR